MKKTLAILTFGMGMLLSQDAPCQSKVSVPHERGHVDVVILVAERR